MGRLTPSFRTVYSEALDDLRTEIRNCFVDLSHKEAFDLLNKEAWRPEEAAMGNSTLPTVLDKLCMVANINTRKVIEVIEAEIKIREIKIERLEEMIESLEEKIHDQAARLDSISIKSTGNNIYNCAGEEFEFTKSHRTSRCNRCLTPVSLFNSIVF